MRCLSVRACVASGAYMVRTGAFPTPEPSAPLVALHCARCRGAGTCQHKPVRGKYFEFHRQQQATIFVNFPAKEPPSCTKCFHCQQQVAQHSQTIIAVPLLPSSWPNIIVASCAAKQPSSLSAIAVILELYICRRCLLQLSQRGHCGFPTRSC